MVKSNDGKWVVLLQTLQPKIQLFNAKEQIAIYGKNSSKLLSHIHKASLNQDYSNDHNVKVNYLQFNKNLNKLNSSLYLSARFEHFKEEFDISLKDFLLDVQTSKKVKYSLNGKDDALATTSLYQNLLEKLHLKDLLSKDLMLLSNGQMRRSRLAQLLLQCFSSEKVTPNLHNINLIDDYVIGLDIKSRKWINEALEYFHDTCENNTTIVSLRTQDEIPEWCQRIIINDQDLNILYDGPKDLKIVECYKKIWNLEKEIATRDLKQYDIDLTTKSGNPVYGKDLVKFHKWYNPLHQHDFTSPDILEKDSQPHIQFKDVTIKYNSMDKPVLSGFNWNIPKFSKWILKGSNGSGKSTLTALLTLDHPQSWCNHIQFHDSLVEVGKTSYADHNAHISCSSPEIHNLCLSKRKTVREVILSGINMDSNNRFSVPNIINENVENLYENHLVYWNLTDLVDKPFNSLSLNDQKLVLFVRSLIKLPELLILDEAFSGMNLETIAKCHYWLDHYWCGTLILVGHLEEELLSNCQIKEL